MALAEADKKLFIAALNCLADVSEHLKPHQKAIITRAAGVVRKNTIAVTRRQRKLPSTNQIALELPFRKLPPSIKRRGRARWAKYSYDMVQEARRLRHVKGWTYRDIAESLNLRFGTKVPWITVRDWCSQYYRVMG